MPAHPSCRQTSSIINRCDVLRTLPRSIATECDGVASSLSKLLLFTKWPYTVAWLIGLSCRCCWSAGSECTCCRSKMQCLADLLSREAEASMAPAVICTCRKRPPLPAVWPPSLQPQPRTELLAPGHPSKLRSRAFELPLLSYTRDH